MAQRPEVMLDNTKHSQLGEPPEKPRPLAPVYGLIAIVMTALVFAFVLLLSPLLLVLMFVRYLAFRSVKYWRRPEDVRVAIVGGGWAGVQATARFLELGVTPTCFEKADGLGGTWHSDLKYHAQQLHAANWVTTFGDKDGPVPYGKNDDENDGKVIGEEMCRHINSFADQRGALSRYTLNADVKTVKMQSKGRSATLVVEDTRTGAVRSEGPFDLVIFASMAAKGSPPEKPGGKDFVGRQYHSSQMKTADFDQIVQRNERVVVVGGSKAASDMMLNLERAGHQNATWVFRKPYLFWKFEPMFHKRSLCELLRASSTLAGIIISLVSPSLGGALFWANGFACTFDKPHNDWSRFRFGVLCPRQRADLARIPSERRRPGTEPVAFTKSGVRLASGEHLEADVVIWATGSSTGLERLALEKDGQPYIITNDTKMFDHFVAPSFPVLASSTSLWTTYGPLRGMNTAEHAVYHLCVRKPLSEHAMESSAAWLLSKNSPLKNFLWSPNMLQDFLFLHIDLMLRGIEPIESFLRHAIEIFVFARMTPLRLKLLPETANAKLAVTEPLLRTGQP